MKREDLWEIYFQKHQYPCVIFNNETKEILYHNEKFLKYFQLNTHIIGENLLELLPSEDLLLSEKLPDWNGTELYETAVYYKKLGKSFQLQAAMLEDKSSVFCQLAVEEAYQGTQQFEEAMTRCMEIYEQEPDSILISLMELLCEFYNCERAYLYRFHTESNTINCVSQWCHDPNFHVIQEVSTEIDYSFLVECLEASQENGIFSANMEEEDFRYDTSITEILRSFKLKNVTICTVENVDHQLVGVLGLSNRQDYNAPFDRRLLHTISRFVAQDVNRGAVNDTLFQLHYRDTLTGLYNRNGYAQRVDQILDEKPKTMGAIVVNINGLKFINENQGISGGDEHIRKSALAIKNHFGFEIFRMSGDEFVGIAPNIPEEEFQSKVMTLYQSMRQENNFDFSFGHAWGGGNFELGKLIYEADTVMYINKQEYYSNSKREFASVKDNTLADLLSYLANDEFMVYLQPQVLLQDGSLYGAEALIRRFDKTNQKMIFPDQFIPLYEQKSVIRHVDMFVLETVSKLQQQWIAQGKQIPISVNFSRVTLQEYGIVDSICEICDKYQVAHDLVVIEVTERVGLIENNVPSALIQQFKDKGFHISLDDFGCAYSNIVTLAQIEVDEVKIDKSLVDFILSSKKNRVLVKNVLSMCNELDGASTLAEGIESEEQAQLLKSLGCRLGQGYFYSRPIPTEEFIKKYME